MRLGWVSQLLKNMESYCMAMSMEVSYSVSQSVQIYFNEVDLNSYNEQLINYLSRFLKPDVIFVFQWFFVCLSCTL